MMRNLMTRRLGALLALLTVVGSTPGCGVLTSIERQADGYYAVTGNDLPGPFGFIWVGDYDPATKTFTIVKQVR